MSCHIDEEIVIAVIWVNIMTYKCYGFTIDQLS